MARGLSKCSKLFKISQLWLLVMSGDIIYAYQICPYNLLKISDPWNYYDSEKENFEAPVGFNWGNISMVNLWKREISLSKYFVLQSVLFDKILIDTKDLTRLRIESWWMEGFTFNQGEIWPFKMSNFLSFKMFVGLASHLYHIKLIYESVDSAKLYQKSKRYK